MPLYTNEIVITQIVAGVSALLSLLLPICHVKLNEKIVRRIYLFDSDNAFDVVRDSDWDTDMKWYSAGIFVAIALSVSVATSQSFFIDFSTIAENKSTFKSPQVTSLLAIFVSTTAILILVPDLAHSMFVKSETGTGAETHVSAGGYFAMATVVVSALARTLIVIAS